MKQINFIFFSTVFALFMMGGLFSCTPMDDYLKYTDGKEIVYTGSVDLVQFRSGKERVVFTGLLISDPKINKVNIYWDNRGDSIIFNVDRKPVGIDTLEVSIPLPEGSYNFQIYTFDINGNSSVPMNAIGYSYGANYERGLYDRPVKDVVQKEDHVLVEWYNSDPTSFVQLDYQDSNDIWYNRIILPENDTTMLADCKPGSEIKMQTYYIPDTLAIDTFKVARSKYISADVDCTNKIKNAGGGTNGILGEELAESFGYPLDWIVNDAVKVDAQRQGWSKTGKSLYFESIADKNIENGKAYQTFTLPKGKYTAEYNCSGGSPLTGNHDRVDLYFVASKGASLPDFNAIEPVVPEDVDKNMLSYYRLEASKMIPGRYQISFVLTEETEITLGFVMTLKGARSIYQVDEVKLTKNAVF